MPAAFADRSSVELAAQFIDPELTPASAALQYELQRRLHAAITQLKDDDRDLILMRPFEQMLNQEVALLLK